MSVVCEQPTIAEKLVPYVEGALAEPDRSEVLEHLRSCEACANEVRLLKSSILALRQAFSRATQYRPLTHISAEDLERFAFEPETLTADVMRSVKLHLAECGECEQEVAMLREMEQELAEKVEPVRAPEALPAALREAVARQFGAVRTVQAAPEARRPWMESFLAFFASLSPKPLLAAGGAMVVLFVGMQFVQNLPEAGAPAAVTTTTDSRQVAERQEVAATPAAPAFGNSREVALLPGRVDSGELPGFSRKLWEAKVSHSYRDGQIFVSAEDVDKARKALQILPREVAAVDLDLDAKQKAQARAAAPPKEAAEERPADEVQPAVETTQPGLAEARVATYDAASRDRATGGGKSDSGKVEASAAAAAPPPKAKPAVVAKADPPKPARPAAAPAPPVVAMAKKGPAPGTETVAVLTPKDKSGSFANPRQQRAPLPIQQQVAVAPNTVVLRGGADDPIAQLPVRSGSEESKAGAESPDAGVRPAPVEPAEREGYATQSAAPPAGEVRRESKEGQALARSNSQNAGAVPYANVGQVGTARNAPASTMPNAGVQAPANRMDDMAVADSALATHARKVASEAIGESTVTVDKRDDGSVVVIVRSGRTLSSQEMDQLRKALRQKLSLADSDTVVIRQP